MALAFQLDGRLVEVPDDGSSLLEVLRDRLGARTAKDGCSPQGQCGCCTVLVDGAPRVACVTPARRVAGRAVTTLDGLPEATRQRWTNAFTATGASQCGFCTPGILMRLVAAHGGEATDRLTAERALLAHLCRCTGWRSVVEAATTLPALPTGRDMMAAEERATIEGGAVQRVGPAVAAGRAGFADDLAPEGALVAVPDGRGSWAVGESLHEARAAARRVPGRRSGVAVRYPLEVPGGEWALTLRTTWVEPGYVESDASWCVPGGEPATPLANGGAFGGKANSPAPAAARLLADQYRRPVRVLLSREDAVRLGPKRPPIAAGLRADGSGLVRVVRTPGIAAAIASVAPELTVEELDVGGPPTSVALRAAGWAEAAVLLAVLAGSGRTQVGSVGQSRAAAGEPRSASGSRGTAEVLSPVGSRATAEVEVSADGLPQGVRVHVACGDPLDEVVLRSYCMGAVHMALGWVCSEAIAVDEEGEVQDLTVRSFGILRAVDTPPIEVAVEPSSAPPVNGSAAVFAAVAAATWIAQGLPPEWPTMRGRFR
ncbi:MAG: 2Fe-2S iron-sulfur cluster-binding protein [Acidimicrobiales bacterium]